MKLRIRAKLILAFLAVGLLPLFAALLVPLYINSSVAMNQDREKLQQARQGLYLHAASIREECFQFGESLLQDEVFAQWYNEGTPTPSRSRAPVWLRYAIDRAQQGLRKYVVVPMPAEDHARWRELSEDDRRIAVHHWSKTNEDGSETTTASIGVVVPLPDDRYGLTYIFIGMPVWRGQAVEDTVVYSQEFVENLAQTYGVNGKLLGQGSGALHDIQSRLRDDAVESLFVQGRALFDEEATISGVESYSVLVPVWSEGEQAASLVMFWVPRSAGVTIWTNLRETLYFGLLGSAALAIVLGVGISRSFSRPIDALQGQVRRITQGDFNYKVHLTSHDELGELGDAFNVMTERLNNTMVEVQNRTRTIQEQNESLDRSVRELEKARAFIESILRQVRGGVLTLDGAGRVIAINPAARRMLGLDQDGEPELIGLPVRACLEDPGMLDWIEEVRSRQTAVEHREHELRHPDGGVLPIEVTITPMEIDPGGEDRDAGGVLLTFVDLSNVKALQERLSRQERLAALGQLTAGVAHEIRNPLGIIKASAELLQARFGNLEQEEGLSQDIIQESERLSRVITEFLSFARPGVPRPTPCDLNELADRALSQLRITPANSGVEYEADLDESLPRVMLDPDQMRQVLLNLLLNARDAMPSGGTITLRTARLGEDHAVFEVRDQGQGIEPEKVKLIFNPFFTTKDMGTGLGLSIVHSIIEQHHGRIEVESQPGQGSIFRVVLPLVSAPAEIPLASG